MEIVMHKGSPTICLGIIDFVREYDEKKIIQMASYYLAGIQYEKCKNHTFYSGEYYLVPFTEELLEPDISQFEDGIRTEKEIKERFKYVFVKVRNIENKRLMV